MRKNRMKEKINGGEAVMGVINNLQEPDVLEVLGLLGMDFAILDGEHTPLTPDTAQDLYRAAELRGLSTMTRVGENSPQVIQKFLDAGSQGVLIPMVNTKQDAQRVVDAVKYPPIGKRGLAAVRAADYGLTGTLGEYVEMANSEMLVTIQIETLEAVENFDEIASVDGIDALFFGPSDLSSSLGMPGQARHPDVLALIERLGKKTVEDGMAAGTIARDVEQFAYWRERGFQLLCTGTIALLTRGVKGLLDDIRRFEDGRA